MDLGDKTHYLPWATGFVCKARLFFAVSCRGKLVRDIFMLLFLCFGLLILLYFYE